MRVESYMMNRYFLEYTVIQENLLLSMRESERSLNKKVGARRKRMIKKRARERGERERGREKD